MAGVTRFLRNCTVLPSRNNRLVRFPEIAIDPAPPVGHWDGLPQLSTTDFVTRSDRIADDLTCVPADRQPDPLLIGFAGHE